MRRILIEGGTVIDGSASARPQKAGVLIEGDRIVAIGRGLSVKGAEALDATGCIVAPGFIDAHAHSDNAALLDTSAQSKAYDGVATEISGCCGLSFFPLVGAAGKSDRKSLKEEGIDATWKDADGYFRAVEAKGTAINRGFLAGHGALREAVIGSGAKTATRSELRRMRKLLAESLEQGALGLSSGLCYAPGCYAKTGELVELCREIAPLGRPYCTHMRNEGRALMQSVREAIEICERSGAALHISHVKTMGPPNWWKIRPLEKTILDARARGVDVTADRYPYLAAMTGLGAIFPDWLHAGGREKAIARLKKRSVREKVRSMLEHSSSRRARWDDIRIAVAGEDMRQFEGMTVQQAAEKLGMDPFDAACEILLRANFRVSAVFFHMSEDNLVRIYGWPFVCIGSDATSRSLKGPMAKGRPHPRAFGTFGRFFSKYVIEKKVLSMPEAVARVTSFPAARFNLRDRGTLRKGAFADITVFDPKKYHDTATYDQPFSLTTGVKHLLVNGTMVLRDGKQTAARSGLVLRA